MKPLVEDYNAPWPTKYGVNPPPEWVNEPLEMFGPGMPIVVTPEGRFNANAFEWHRLQMSHTDPGWTPSPSPTGNRWFHGGTIHTADGGVYAGGKIPLWGGHAPRDYNNPKTTEFYEDPAKTGALVRMVETDWGGVACGAIKPGLTHTDVGIMRVSPLSADWRQAPYPVNDLDLMGVCFVNVPDLPVGLEEAVITAALRTDNEPYRVNYRYDTQTDPYGKVISATSQPIATQVREPVLASFMDAITQPKEKYMSNGIITLNKQGLTLAEAAEAKKEIDLAVTETTKVVTASFEEDRMSTMEEQQTEMMSRLSTAEGLLADVINRLEINEQIEIP